MSALSRRMPVLVQWPNPPLWVALAGAAVSRVTGGWPHAYASAAFYGGLSVWAYLELTDGVNWFRRLLGAAGLVYAAVRLAGVVHD